jgi:DNA polymerase-3 subunit epsilon
MKIAFIDTETTGLDPNTNEIIELAIVVVDTNNKQFYKEVNYYFDPVGEIDPGAARVNGFYKGKWQELKYQISGEHDVAKILLGLNSIDAIVAHNVSFDRSFLVALFKKYGYPMSQMPKYWFDTCTMAFLFKMYRKDFARISMDFCLSYFNLAVRTGQHHGALEDAKLLKELFFKMLEYIKIEEKNETNIK